MVKVVGFGDLLVRLSPPGYQRFVQASSFDVNYTGAEANVLVSLAYNGVDTQFVTRIPDNSIGACAISMLRRFNVGLNHVVLGGERIGAYYLEKGASQRPSKIIYDRAHTGIATAKRGDFDWDSIFKGATHFHFTGITPALGEELPQICKDACEAAKDKGVIISCDLNYRSALWDVETATRVMRDLVQYVDILVGNEEDSEKLLGVKPKDCEIEKGKLSKEAYAEVASEIARQYGMLAVAFTLRESISASENGWSGILYQDGNIYYSRDYRIHLIDRVGGGDSFASGLLYATIKGFDPQMRLEYAVAASSLKQAIKRDFNLSSQEEIMLLALGNGCGRIHR